MKIKLINKNNLIALHTGQTKKNRKKRQIKTKQPKKADQSIT